MKKFVSLILALLLLTAVSASASGVNSTSPVFADPGGMIEIYNDFVSTLANASLLKMEYSWSEDSFVEFATTDNKSSIFFGGLSGDMSPFIVIYVMPDSRVDRNAAISFACVAYEVDPSIGSEFIDWMYNTGDEGYYNCGLFNATASIVSTETTDNILSIRIESKH